MKKYYLKIEEHDITITFTPKDVCKMYFDDCPLKEGEVEKIGSIGSSFVCPNCISFKGIDIPLLMKTIKG